MVEHENDEPAGAQPQYRHQSANNSRHRYGYNPDLNAAMLDAYRQLQSVYEAFTRQYVNMNAQYGKMAADSYRPELAELYREFITTRGTELVQDAMRFSIGYAASMQALSQRYTDELFAFLQHRDVSENHPPEQQTLVLKGAPGTMLAASFELENCLPHAVAVSISATPVVDGSGEHVPGALIEPVPDTLNLAPGQKHPVKLHIPLPAEIYHSENTYTSAVSILGMGEHGDRLIPLRIEVL
ncbi:MAG: hypothetical protein CTY34_10735 [Methylobacter sp.]|nr:MAG: hypothetical protein CTY34_10735 [Methylobacter sp.]PPD33874.1 MAG: hypothetical protein CTY18_09340 [Methylomonas sp.]